MGHAEPVVAAAPRIDPRLRRVARRLGRRGSRAADVHRSVGDYAGKLDLARPSYQQIRLFVNQARMEHAARLATAQLLLEVQLGVRPVTDLLQLLEE
jgi:hypothetical protein